MNPDPTNPPILKPILQMAKPETSEEEHLDSQVWMKPEQKAALSNARTLLKSHFPDILVVVGVPPCACAVGNGNASALAQLLGMFEKSQREEAGPPKGGRN